MKKLGLLALGVVVLAAASGVSRAAVDEPKRFTIHGEVSFRGERWNNMIDHTDSSDDPDCAGIAQFPGTNQSDHCNDSFDMFPYRIRLAASGDLGHDIWVYGEFQSHGIAGGGPDGTLNEPTNPFFGDGGEDVFNSGVSLYQGWVKLTDVGTTVLDITIGRQEIAWDNGLLYGKEEFYNGRSFDGAMASWDWDKWGISGWWARITDFNVDTVGQLDPFSDGDNEAVGVHANFNLGRMGRHHLAGYGLYNEGNSVGLAASDDRTKLYTAGGVWGWDKEPDKNGFDFSAELAVQFGDWSCDLNPGTCPAGETSIDISAWILEGWAGYTFDGDEIDQRVHAYLLWASGDGDPGDEDWEAFVPIYGNVHERLGYADQFLPTNIEAYSVGWTGTIATKHTVEADFWLFKRAEEDQAVSSPTTGFIVAEAGTDTDLGQELDVWYDYAMTPNFSLGAGSAWYDPGDGVEQTLTDPAFGGDPNADGSAAGWRLITRARARW